MGSSIKLTLIGMLLIGPSFLQIAVTESAPDTDLNLEHAKLLDGAALEEFKKSPVVASVYYFHEAKQTSKSRGFLQEYDKSASYLKSYDLSLGLVDCRLSLTDEKLKAACEETDREKIYVYRDGAFLLDLELQSMFDVNSIMANVLQLALLDEVLIVQNLKNRQQLEHKSAGNTDIIFSYHAAIGTPEHRALMEIAYAYRDQYKFVISTVYSSIDGLQDAELVPKETGTSMWVLYCRDKYDPTIGCRSVAYRGEWTLPHLASFFKFLASPRVVYGYDHHPCDASRQTPCIYILYTEATKDKVREVVDSLQFDVHGTAGLILRLIGEEEVRSQDPELNLDIAGGDQVIFRKDWNLENVEAFVASHIFPLLDKETEQDSPESVEDSNDAPDSIDDMVLAVDFKQRETMGKATSIPALNDKSFYPTVKGRKLTIVLFYIPFDSVGMIFLGPYQEAKKATLRDGEDPSAHPLMRVDCFDWTDICAKENITTYPVIHIYRDGGKRRQYRHALDKDVLARTVFLLRAEQPLMLKTEKEVKAFVKGQLPEGTKGMVDNLVLLNPSKSEKEVKAFKKAARALETQMLFAIVSSGVSTDVVPEGSVLHVRLNDEYQPSETLSENLSAESIKVFLLKGHLNLLPELTHLNFPELYVRKQPFGILFYNPSSEDASSQMLTIVNTIKTNKAPGIIFCKMSMDENAVAETILSNYTKEVVLPSFAIVNHQKGQVHVLQGADVLSEEMLLPWIQDVQDGSLPPTKILEKGEWKPPGRHYDFLTLMDKEAAKKKKKKQQEKTYQFGDPLGDDAAHYDTTQFQEKEEEIRSSLLELQKSRLYSGKAPLRSPVEDTAQKAAEEIGTTTATIKGTDDLKRHTEL